MVMSNPRDFIPPELFFYASAPHPCSYLDEQAVTLFADPNAEMSKSLYSALSDLGFRRSGEFVYSPRCPACNACLPVRIPVEEFQPDRSQRRNWKQNSDLTVTLHPAEFNERHFDLYRRYMDERHPDGSMAKPDQDQYIRFFVSRWADTRFVEFAENGRPLAISVMDVLDQGLSAVYTFFDPLAYKRGLGVYAVLWLIEEAKRRQLPYLYLGYLIHESPKMNYKTQYRPLEFFHDGLWQPLPLI
jgi:leucyl-tRNA---protein transferase